MNKWASSDHSYGHPSRHLNKYTITLIFTVQMFESSLLRDVLDKDLQSPTLLVRSSPAVLTSRSLPTVTHILVQLHYSVFLDHGPSFAASDPCSSSSPWSILLPHFWSLACNIQSILQWPSQCSVLHKIIWNCPNLM